MVKPTAAQITGLGKMTKHSITPSSEAYPNKMYSLIGCDHGKMVKGIVEAGFGHA